MDRRQSSWSACLRYSCLLLCALLFACTLHFLHLNLGMRQTDRANIGREEREIFYSDKDPRQPNSPEFCRILGNREKIDDIILSLFLWVEAATPSGDDRRMTSAFGGGDVSFLDVDHRRISWKWYNPTQDLCGQEHVRIGRGEGWMEGVATKLSPSPWASRRIFTIIILPSYFFV